jgi:hypothetical protein
MGETGNIPNNGGSENYEPPADKTTFDNAPHEPSCDPYLNPEIDSLKTWRVQPHGAIRSATPEFKLVNPIFHFEALPVDAKMPRSRTLGKRLLGVISDYELPPYATWEN